MKHESYLSFLILPLLSFSAFSSVTFSDSIYRFPKGTIVIEAERPETTTFIADHFDPLFMTKTNGAPVQRSFPVLRNGAASLLSTKKKPAGRYFAAYTFTVQSRFSGTLWTFEQGREWASPLRWRIDSLPWVTVSNDIRMHRWTKLDPTGPTFAWSRLGTVENLSSGNHRLEIDVSGRKADSTFLLSQDCIALVPTMSTSGIFYPFISQYTEPSARSVYLWDTDTIPGSTIKDGTRPWLDPYLVKSDKPSGAVLVFPGGSYRERARIEGEPVARAFNKMGYHAFVVHYRTIPHRYPAQLYDAARAVRIVRSRAKEWNVNPGAVAAVGFSAGGHLAGMLGVHYNRVPSIQNDPVDTFSCRPDALVLGYPVTSMFGKFDHAWIMPEESTVETRRLMSIDLWVTRRTPPTFLWHCYDDDVTIRHSMVFGDSLYKNKVPFELHVFHKGGHGIGIAEKDPHAGSWVRLAGGWLKDVFESQIDFSKIRNGTYRGTYVFSQEPYTTTADLKFSDGKITGVQWEIMDTHRKVPFDSTYERFMDGNREYIEQCRKDWKGSRTYGPQLVREQDIGKVDAVTGATWTYKLFRAAVKDALGKAVSGKKNFDK